MARFGISSKNTLGIPVPELRRMARELGKNHELAIELWESGIHEARLLASMVAELEKFSEAEADSWIEDFDSWDVCDQACMNLLYATPFAFEKALEWSERKEEFEKRAGFALMACIAFKDKKAKDSDFESFFAAIKRESGDERNFVRKAVNWALRQIGKRNEKLRKRAIAVAREIRNKDSKSAKWIANDALRELEKTNFSR
jgi:3-methyladenine DNA glycosylase AlkD